MPLKRKTKLKNQYESQQKRNTIKNTHNKRADKKGKHIRTLMQTHAHCKKQQYCLSKWRQ